RRLRENGRVAAVTAKHGREGAEPAVLLAHHRVHGERALKGNASGTDGAHHGEVCGNSSLHVAGTATVQHPPHDVAGERVTAVPLLQLALRHNVDVTLQHERRLTVTRGDADNTVAFAPVGLLTRVERVRAQLVEVELPAVNVHAQLVEGAGLRVLEVGLRV